MEKIDKINYYLYISKDNFIIKTCLRRDFSY